MGEKKHRQLAFLLVLLMVEVAGTSWLLYANQERSIVSTGWIPVVFGVMGASITQTCALIGQCLGERTRRFAWMALFAFFFVAAAALMVYSFVHERVILGLLFVATATYAAHSLEKVIRSLGDEKA